MKLKSRILLLFLTIGLVPLLLTSTIYYFQTRAALRAEISQKLQAISLIQKNRLISIHQKSKEVVSLIAKRPSLTRAYGAYLKEGDPQELEFIKTNLASAFLTVHEFKEILLLDNTGKILVTTNGANVNLPVPKEKIFPYTGTETRGDLFYLDEFQQLCQLYISPIIINGYTVGVICIKARSKAITDIVNDYTGLGQTGETVLGMLDENGDALFISSLRKDPNAALKRKIPKETNAPVVISLRNKKEFYTESNDYLNERVFASSRYIPETKWSIVSKINVDEALQPLQRIKTLTLILTLLSIALIIGLALYFSHTITKPILLLTGAAQNIIRGVPQQEVKVETRNEIGVLASAFNGMVAKLNFVNKAGETLSESLDYKSILSKISNLIVPTLADWFAIDLVENGNLETLTVTHRDPLKIKLAHELQKKYPRSLSSPTGVAKVIRTGQSEFIKTVTPQMVRQSAQDEEHYRIIMELGFISGIIVPLKIKGIVVGAISMVTGKESGRQYTDFDLNMAEDLARRISVTLENARLFNEAKELNEKKDEFMNIASHELKTPLSTAKAYIQLAERDVAGKFSDTTLTYIKKARLAIGKLQSLIAELLDVSRIQAGKLHFHFQEIDFDDLLDEVIENFRNSEISHRIEKEGNFNRKIIADKDRIEQVIINMLTNAVKYSPEADLVKVKVWEENEEVIVSVQDFGIGIPARNSQKIFERYYRVETGGVRFQGLGIGLYISSQIIKRHHGKMWVESVEGEGSTFFFSIPFTQPSNKDKTE